MRSQELSGIEASFFTKAALMIHSAFFDEEPSALLLRREAGAVQYVYATLSKTKQERLRRKMLSIRHPEAVEFYLRIRGRKSGLTELFQAVVSVSETDHKCRKFMVRNHSNLAKGYCSLLGGIVRSVGLFLIGALTAGSFWND